MANLKKREIIILAVAVVFVLYAGYEYLIAPASKKVKTSASANSVKVDSFVNETIINLSKEKLTDSEGYMIKRMAIEWGKNPFWKKDFYKAWVNREGLAKGSGALANIIYSGYVDSGKNKMAVINGFEYKIGDELEIEGYVLKQITPSKILIVNKYTESKEEIPLQE